ncbi:MAG: AarF/ABC1/UbiB kinase family protein, partial [Ktedonobacteraceae bacterium]|nr:AarF/ABC1/UbiB kinase family protein [Ktedonobacteraceae bacterium]
DPTIYIPRVYDEYVSRRMLVLEWIDGIKINDYEALEAAGIDRLQVAERTVSSYFHQFFDENSLQFHADPHPGNIFVKQNPAIEGPVIAFVDFGMVGSLTNSMKRSLRDLFVGFVTRDTRSLVDALNRLGFIGEGANMASIERGLGLMVEQFYGMTLGQVRELDIPDVASEIEDLLYGQPFQIPAQFAFTGRAVGTLVGVATGLAPSFNFVDVATPYVQRFLGLDSENIGKTVQDVATQLLETGQLLLRLPRSLERMISKIETGQLEVRLAGVSNGRPARGRRGRGRRNGGNGALVTQNNGSGKLALSFVFAASLAGGIFLATAQVAAASWFCLGVAGIVALSMVLRR